MTILTVQLVLAVILYVGYRILRRKYMINRSGYITKVDSYIQDNNKILIEDIHFWKKQIQQLSQNPCRSI